VYQGKPVKVRIWFSPDAAGYIKEKIWHDTQKIVPQTDGSIVFEAKVAGTEEIKFSVMSWGSRAEVIEPQSLREEIRLEAETAVEKYGRTAAAQQEPATAQFDW
jgi:predicted DNA-binding transcriptional regulator YafY